MPQLHLVRFSYSPTETEGFLYLDDGSRLFTIERPWRSSAPGGMPFESCVPDGTYSLVPHVRSNGDEVFALWNPDLHVWHTPQERNGRPGRDLILIHAGNRIDDIVGCVAPGLARTIHNNHRMVTRSRAAMQRIMSVDYESIVIEPGCGATNNVTVQYETDGGTD